MEIEFELTPASLLLKNIPCDLFPLVFITVLLPVSILLESLAVIPVDSLALVIMLKSFPVFTAPSFAVTIPSDLSFNVSTLKLFPIVIIPPDPFALITKPSELFPFVSIVPLSLINIELFILFRYTA